MRKSARNLLCLFFLVCPPVFVFSQTNDCDTYPQGVNTLNDVVALRTDLTSGQWAKALERWYSGTHECDLVDMIVYIDGAGTARVGMARGVDTGHVFFGQKSMWVLVISESSYIRDDTALDTINFSRKNTVSISDTTQPYDNTSGKVPTASPSDENNKRVETTDSTTSVTMKIRRYSFRVTREALQYERGSSESTAAGMLALLLQLISKSASGLPPTPDALRDSTVYLTLKPHYDSKRGIIYGGIAKFNLALNTYNRIVVSPAQEGTFRSVQTHFGNYDNSPVSASVGVGITQPVRTPGFDPAHPDSGNAKLYIFGNWYLRSPRLPISPTSFAFTLGTNILANIFDDVIFGFRWGPWFEPLGVIVGGNWKLWSDHVRRVGLFLGIDYPL